MQKNSLSYCGQFLRQNDPDRFLLSLFAPTDVREDVWALLAFNYEIAKTRSVVSESTLGLIRLQWWRDEIGKIYDGATSPAHEVLQPLSTAIRVHNLPREDFETLIYAREFDLEDVLPGNLEGLMNYADFTTTPLLRLILRIMGENPAFFPLQAIGINVGLSEVMRAAQYHARHGRCYWPEDLMRRHNVTREDFFNGRSVEAFAEIAMGISAGYTPQIKPENRMLRAFDGLARVYFLHFKALKYNVFSQKWVLQPAFKALRVWLRTIY